MPHFPVGFASLAAEIIGIQVKKKKNLNLALDSGPHHVNLTFLSVPCFNFKSEKCHYQCCWDPKWSGPTFLSKSLGRRH